MCSPPTPSISIECALLRSKELQKKKRRVSLAKNRTNQQEDQEKEHPRMSIEHEYIEEVLAAHEGHEVRVTGSRRGLALPIFQGQIPANYEGKITLMDGTACHLPEKGVRYSEIVIGHGGAVVQRLLPRRTASEERGILADMLAEAKEERAAAQRDRDAAAARAETQRLTMLNDAQKAAADAKADRDTLAALQLQRDTIAAAERNQLMQAISALSSLTPPTPSRALGFPPGSSANPHIVGSGGSGASISSSVVSLPADVITMMRRREDDESRVFSSWESTRTDFFSAAHLTVLKGSLPEYRWLKSNAHALDLRAALRAAADSIAENAGKNHDQHLAQVITVMTASGRTATAAQAAELQVVMSIAATAAGSLDWPRVVIAEMAVAACRAIPIGTIDRLKAARCTLPEAGQYAIGSLSALPLQHHPQQQQQQKRTNNSSSKRDKSTTSTTSTFDSAAAGEERKCRRCGKQFRGPWSLAACAAGHF